MSAIVKSTEFEPSSEEINFYELLGVAPTATLKDIHAAYKKLVKKYHPDLPGGDQKLFTKIKSAYDILSDPEKRRLYDEFGMAGGSDTEMIDSARSEIQGCFDAVLNNMDIDKIETFDFVSAIKQHLTKALNANKNKKQEFEKVLAKYMRAIAKIEKRLKHKRGAKDVIFVTVIQRKIGMLECQIPPLDTSVTRLKIALTMLDSYTWETESNQYNEPYAIRPVMSLYGNPFA